MKELKIFENEEFGKIRSVMVNNEPYFVAKDICDILELENSRQALTRIDEDEKADVILNDGSQNRHMTAINEYGLYNLILASRKPEAKAFKKWITHEVIPSIRKTGGYIAGEESMTEDELVLKAINVLNKKIENLRTRNEKLLADNNKKDQLIGELRPKADYTDRILQCDDLTKVNVIACDYGFSATEFNKILNKFGIQYKQGQAWLLYSNYRGQGYTQTKTFEFTHKDGTKGSRPNMMWTQKGRLFLYNFLKERGIYPRMEVIETI